MALERGMTPGLQCVRRSAPPMTESGQAILLDSTTLPQDVVQSLLPAQLLPALL